MHSVADPFCDVDLSRYDRDLDALLAFLRTVPDTMTAESMEFHLYWKNVRPFGRKQILPIKSFLATQPKNFMLNLWSDADLTQNSFLRPWLPHIRFRIYNAVAESRGTVLENSSRLHVDDPMVYAGGDLFRALILYKHGGVYVDMDSVFLRSFACLFGAEFMYRWSFRENQISSAVMHLKQSSEIADELLRGIAVLEPGGTNWGCLNNVRAYRRRPFRVYPCGFFNPEWQIELTCEQKQAMPNFGEPFQINPVTNELYEGSFVWHWHNRWEEPIAPGCKFEILESLTHGRLLELGYEP